MTLNEHETPPGGWQFYQPQTGWSAPTPIASTFDQTKVLIQKHRLANPAIVVRHQLAMDSASIGRELMAFQRARLGIPEIAPMPPNPPSPQPRPAPAVVEGSKGLIRVAQGSGPILEWFASGRPAVDRPLAEKRAATCSDCPKNKTDDQTLLQWFVQQAGKVIARGLEARQDLKLETTQDAKLGVCDACLCPMKTKVHCPLDIVLSHLKPEVRADLDPRCWILKNDQ